MTLKVSRNNSLNSQDCLHFIGIGGSGMSALAELAHHRGFKVAGSDLRPSIVTDRLTKLGITITFGHSASALNNATIIVCSSAIAHDNPELAEALRRKLLVLHRSELLALLMQEKSGITVAGTHGKSTTSAMIVHMLTTLGLDPEAVLGGAMRQYGSAARYGQGKILVAEADESDGSFLRYKPFVGIATNIDLDHMEFYKSPAALQDAFLQYLNGINSEGFAVIGWDSPLLREAAQTLKVPRLAYGFVLGSDVRAINYRCAQGESSFTAIVERDQFTCRLPTIGKHNVQNALACLALARGLSLDINDAIHALSTFPGVERRMNLVYKSETIAIFDDYAHNPGKISACLQALRESFRNWQLHVIYQPHRYSRLETMYDEMIGAVKIADIVHMLPVYAAGEVSERDFSPQRLADDLSRVYGIKSIPCQNFDSAIKSVLNNLKPPSVILTVGAGDVWKVARNLKEQLE